MVRKLIATIIMVMLASLVYVESTSACPLQFRRRAYYYYPAVAAPGSVTTTFPPTSNPRERHGVTTETEAIPSQTPVITGSEERSNTSSGVTENGGTESPQGDPVTAVEQKYFEDIHGSLELSPDERKALEEGWRQMTSPQRLEEYEKYQKSRKETGVKHAETTGEEKEAGNQDQDGDK